MITVIDAICGKGKTSYAIQMMKEREDDKFIYITPFRTEIKRVVKSCNNRYFEEPLVEYDSSTKKSNKYNSFKKLIEDGLNVVSTHALFKYSDETILQDVKNNEYILILDEVMDVVQQLEISKDDINMLINNKVIEVKNDGKIVWIDNEYDGEFKKFKQSIINGDCYHFNNSIIFWTFPIEVFKSFKEVYILTYLFNGQYQRYYYDMNNVEYQYATVIKNQENRYELTHECQADDMSNLRQLIHVYEGDLNNIGEPKRKSQPLSKTWYERQTNEKCKIVKDNMYNYFQHITNAKSNQILWTTFNKYQSKCKGKGYSKGYIPCNCRATNDYQNRNVLAYCVNRYSNPMILNFFKSYDVEIDEFTYATSELVQWIFRSALRNNEEIWIYIPSLRMRNILYNFIEDYDKIK